MVELLRWIEEPTGCRLIPITWYLKNLWKMQFAVYPKSKSHARVTNALRISVVKSTIEKTNLTMRNTLLAFSIAFGLITSPLAIQAQMPTYRFSPRPVPKGVSKVLEVADPSDKTRAILNALVADSISFVSASVLPPDVSISAVTTILSAYGRWRDGRDFAVRNRNDLLEVRQNIRMRTLTLLESRRIDSLENVIFSEMKRDALVMLNAVLDSNHLDGILTNHENLKKSDSLLNEWIDGLKNVVKSNSLFQEVNQYDSSVINLFFDRVKRKTNAISRALNTVEERKGKVKSDNLFRWYAANLIVDRYQGESEDLSNEILSAVSGMGGREYNHVAYENLVDSKKRIDKSLDSIQSIADDLYQAYVDDFVGMRSRIPFPGPKRASSIYRILYDPVDTTSNFHYFSNFSFFTGRDGSNVYSELSNGVIGPLRLSFGGLISTSADSTKEQVRETSLQKLSTVGGNAALNVEYPWLYVKSKSVGFQLVSRIMLRGNADLPGMSGTSAFAGSMSLGSDTHIALSTDNRKMNFYFNLNVMGIRGNDAFVDNLGLKNKGFLFSNLSAGVMVNNQFRVNFTLPAFSSEPSLRTQKVIVGVQFIR